ncbi:Rne/Rng family ribonuclease [Solwaraspora sp. WMMB335]|uniref:Rne/Rng family ribonuclease n=1 Tax=Solwaraspora sp. WMMB335 TaxID=3404118 RepID=UPI003B9223A4
MLENEPEGGDRTGTEPVGESADVTRSAAAGRTARRRTTKAAANAANAADGQTGVSAEPATPVTGGNDAPAAPAPAGEAPVVVAAASAEAPAAVAEPAEPRTRRRRKAVADVTGDSADQAVPDQAGGATEDPPGALGPAVGSAPVVKKVTRSRRKKAAEPAAVVDAADSEPAPGAAAAPQLAVAPAAPPESPGGSRPGGPTTEPLTSEPVVEIEPGAPVEPDEPAGTVEPGGAAGSAEPVKDRRTTRQRRSASSPPAVLFMAPDPQAPPTAATAKPAATAVTAKPAVAAEPAPAGEQAGAEAATDAEPVRRRRRGRRSADGDAVEPAAAAGAGGEAAEEAEPAAAAGGEAADEDTDEDDGDTSGRRRRRRGRRGRGRGKGGVDDDADTEEAVESDAGAVDGDSGGDGSDDDDGESLTRRRRRRRRRGSGDADSAAEDGVPTVVKIREPRKTVDEVQGVTGSTRLEAKRQRRRDGREQRRTRPPILSESEFLARREAVDRDMVVRQRGDRTQIAVLEDGILVEHYVTRASSGTMAGNVYLGKVQNVLPSMEAAFVDVGRGRNAVLYAGEVNWDATGLEGRARSIEQALRSGDSVLVQVTKDPIGHKGARLTSHIALSGRHLVYVPNGNASGISRKLPDTERKRLRDILKKLIPDGAGVIVRTAAEGASEDELSRDVKRLQAQWEDIQAKASSGGAPVLLYEEPDLVIRVVRDLFNEDFRELIVQGDTAYEMVESYLAHVSPDLLPRLRRHAAVADVFTERRIDEQILKGLDRKVFLPSGGHLVIDRTEAMTVIDVNTGKYTGAGGNLEETVTRNNLEAAEEIVRQLRLRDIGGIVVIDFIDMVLESNRELVLRRLTECLGRDRTKHQVTEITSLGLVQMTRKRIGAGLLEAFSETCDCCKGRGLIIHTEPVPDKGRAGGAGSGAGTSSGAPAVDKVKAVASAAPSGTTTTSSGRRRGRKAADPAPDATELGQVGSGAGPDAVEPGPTTSAMLVSEPSAPVAEPSGSAGVAAAGRAAVEYDEDETMGYDLSRYEVDPASDAGNGVSHTRLAGADDPDLATDDDELDREAVAAEYGSGGRRRVRRGGARRRTRP